MSNPKTEMKLDIFSQPGGTRNPLSIFSILVGTVATALIYAITKTTGNVQVGLTILLAVWLLLVLVLFSMVLWVKPHHFFSPAEYKKQFTPLEHAQAIYGVKFKQIAEIPIDAERSVMLKETRVKALPAGTQNVE